MAKAYGAGARKYEVGFNVSDVSERGLSAGNRSGESGAGKALRHTSKARSADTKRRLIGRVHRSARANGTHLGLALRAHRKAQLTRRSANPARLDDTRAPHRDTVSSRLTHRSTACSPAWPRARSEGFGQIGGRAVWGIPARGREPLGSVAFDGFEIPTKPPINQMVKN